jgi:hypothetical protein
MRTACIVCLLSLAAVAPAYAQEAAPAFTRHPSSAPHAVAAQAPQPVSTTRRFRITRTVAQVVREIHARGVIRVPEPEIRIDNKVAAGAIAGLALGALALGNDCESAPGKCPVTKYLTIGAGAGALVGAIAASGGDD